MSKLVLIFSIVLLISAASIAQTTIYVSPAGSDSNPGTISQPLLTISKAMSLATAGTTIYLRGGAYNISSTLGASVSGSVGNYINLWAYPGETPILDFSGESYSSSSRGIELKRNYWNLKGLVIRNAGDNGIYVSGNYNIVENCHVSNCKDTGIQISDGGSYNYIHNCDAFGNNDPATNGQNADGIDAKLVAGPGNVIRGCRVYDNADDGYDCYGTGYKVVFDSCWAFHNGYNLWNIQNFTGNGNGFKLGGADSIGPHIVTNCVSFDNVVKGFDQNNNMAGITLYNCTAFRNGTYNFSFPYAPKVGEDTLKNDLSYDGGQGDYNITSASIQVANSWQGHTVTSADFLSLDTSLARIPRNADGSLPATVFLRLAPGSSLIDAGVNVGLPYVGSAPDIGAFESGTGPTILTTNGTGGGDWNSASTWAGGVVPNDSSNAIILGGDSVIVSTADSAVCGDLTILSNAKLNDAGTISVGGTLSLLPGAWFYNGNSSLHSFPPAGSYNIDNASNFVLMGSGSSVLGAVGSDSTFGNVIVQKSGTTCGADLSILGNLTINTGGSGNTFRATNASVNRSLTETVDGNVYVISGQWSCVDGGNDLTGIWDIGGSVFVGDSSTVSGQARMGPFSGSSSAHRLGIFNIGGNLSLINGARLQAGSSTGSTSTTETGIINLDGNLSIDSTVIFATNSRGVFALNFVGSSTQSVTLRRPFVMSSSTMQPTVNDTIPVGSSVSFTSTGTSWSAGGPGNFVVDGTLTLPAGDTLKGGQSFVLNDNATLAIGSPNGLDTDGSIQVTGGQTYGTNTNYVFNGTATQVTGTGLPSSVHNLTALNTNGVLLTKPLTANGVLNVVAGKLILGPNDLVAAAISGGSPVRYVVTDSTGVLKVPAVGSSQVLFPVGTMSEYAPVWITNAGTADTFSVSVAPDSATTPKVPGRVDVKWNISEGTPGGSNCALQFGWMASEEDSAFAANRAADARVFLYADSTYTEAGSGAYTAQLTTQPYTVARSGITSFGAFAVGNFSLTPVLSAGQVPSVFKLYQNYPNPFNPSTEIDYSVPKLSHVTLTVFDVLGREVATLVDQEEPAGKYRSRFNGSDLASGVYYYQLKAGSSVQTKKLMLIK